MTISKLCSTLLVSLFTFSFLFGCSESFDEAPDNSIKEKDSAIEEVEGKDQVSLHEVNEFYDLFFSFEKGDICLTLTSSGGDEAFECHDEFINFLYFRPQFVEQADGEEIEIYLLGALKQNLMKLLYKEGELEVFWVKEAENYVDFSGAGRGWSLKESFVLEQQKRQEVVPSSLEDRPKSFSCDLNTSSCVNSSVDCGVLAQKAMSFAFKQAKKPLKAKYNKKLKPYIYTELKLKSKKNEHQLKVSSTVAGRVDRRFFGANVLYWIDGKPAWEQEEAGTSKPLFQKRLVSLGVKSLRFPGGEVADNYNWETNRLDDGEAFPYENGSHPIETRLDYKSFIAEAKKSKAEPILVVNLDGSYVNKGKGLRAHVRSAAKWVCEANLKNKFGVKYWEIGNESYHATSRRSVGVGGYIHALKRFSIAMKKIDPTIKIGAIGPYGAQESAFFDKLNAGGKKRFRALDKKSYENLRDRLGGDKQAIKHLNQSSKSKSKPWWGRLGRNSGRYFDFMVMHRYDGTRGAGFMSKAISIKEEVVATQNLTYPYLNQRGETAATEWNVASNVQKKLNPARHALAITEQITDYLKAGTQIGNFWPLRMRYGWKSLLKHDSMEVESLGQAFRLFARSTWGVLLRSGSSHKLIDILATRSFNKKKQTVFIINRSSNVMKVNLEHDLAIIKRIERLHDTNKDGVLTRELLKPKNKKSKNHKMSLPPESISKVVLLK